MKIIGNSCVGTFLVEVCYNLPFITPFSWCRLDYDSILYLISNWNTIDFDDYELVKDYNWNFSVIIEKNVKIQYVHYRFDPRIEGVKKINGDKFSNRIWVYINDLYEKRIKSMAESKDEPIFILSTVHKIEPNYLNEVQRNIIADAANKNKLKVIFGYHDISDDELRKSNENIEYIRLAKGLNHNTVPTADFIFHHSKILGTV